MARTKQIHFDSTTAKRAKHAGKRLPQAIRAPKVRVPRRRHVMGARALQEIRKFQKSTDLIIPKASFQRAVRQIAQERCGEIR